MSMPTRADVLEAIEAAERAMRTAPTFQAQQKAIDVLANWQTLGAHLDSIASIDKKIAKGLGTLPIHGPLFENIELRAVHCVAIGRLLARIEG
jgi:hypothetical protein